MQQLHRLLHRSTGLTAGDGHHVGIQRRQQVGDCGGVIGQRRDHVRVTGVGDHPGLSLAPMGQQVEYFLPGPRQPGRRLVSGFHGVAQVEDNDQGVLFLVHGLWQLFPARSAGGHRGQNPPQYYQRQQVGSADARFRPHQVTQ